MEVLDNYSRIKKLKAGNLIPAASKKDPRDFRPQWINPQLIKDGYDFIRSNFFSIFFAHFISLIFLLCYTPVRDVLLRTGRSESVSRSRIRYFSTLLHIKFWYENDLLNEESEAVKDIQFVRIIHEGVANRCCRKMHASSETEINQEDYKECEQLRSTILNDLGITNGSSLDINNNINSTEEEDSSRCSTMTQLDMSVTQFCFMGLLQMFPEKMGIHKSSERGIEGFVHIWALIGHYLGIQDEFNICLSKNVELRDEIWKNVLIPEFRTCEIGTIKLWRSLIQGASSYIYFISVNSVLKFILLNFFNLRNSDLNLNIFEYGCFMAMRQCFSNWLKFKWAREFFNLVLRYAIWLASVRFYLKGDINKKLFWRIGKIELFNFRP